MDFTLDNATTAVQASFDTTADSRLRDIVQHLTTHLHEFVLETGVTLDEWAVGIEFLTQVGKWCSDTRQEWVLLSDIFGVSMLVETLNHQDGQNGGTENTVLGPFHMTKSPPRELGDSIDLMGRQQPCIVTGTVKSTDGTSISNAEVDVWQCTEDGYYDVQQPDVQPAGNGRGIFRTDAAGRFWFRTIVPSHYPIPTDGPVGKLLKATGRHPYRPAHIHFIAAAPGHDPVTTHAFVSGSPYIDSDAVFAVKSQLLVDFTECDDPDMAAEFGLEAPFVHANFNIVLRARP